MSVARRMCSVVLRPMLSAARQGGVERASQALGQFLTADRRLLGALTRAQIRAWQALEMTIAGKEWVSRVATPDPELQGQLARFIENNPMPVPRGTWDRITCLNELRQAQKSGLLRTTPDDCRAAADDASTIARFADHQAVINQERAVLADLVAQIRKAGFSHFAALLELSVQGEPLVVRAACYFFRREIEGDEFLARSLTISMLGQVSAAAGAQTALLDLLSKDQRRYFGDLHVAMQKHQVEVIKLLDQALDVLFALKKALEEQARLLARQSEQLAVQNKLLGQQVGQVATVIQGQQDQNLKLSAIEQAIEKLEERLGVAAGALNTRAVLASSSDEATRQEVQTLLLQFRNLPATQQQQTPALLDSIGRLLTGTGQYPEAAGLFREASQHYDDRRAKAEASYNSHRAMLERRKDWPAALSALVKAGELDPERFELFPLRVFPTEGATLLEVTGTGLTIRCKTGVSSLIIKTINDETLDRPVDVVMAEQRQLGLVPGMVQPTNAGYGDVAKSTRPYLVYPDLQVSNLETELHKTKQGLPPDRMLPLALDVGRILRDVHKAGLLHRDVRPGNVLVVGVNNAYRVQMTGLGLALRPDYLRQARKAAESSERSLTASQMSRVTDYLSPEQRGESRAFPEQRSDIYSFARLCCFALFRTPRPALGRWKRLGMPPLRRLIDECLSDDPGRRPRSMDEVLGRLGEIRPRRIAPRAAPPPQQPQQVARPKPKKMARWKLVVEKGLRVGAEYPLKLGETVIGWFDGTPVDVDLDDQEDSQRVECSRRHARLLNEEGKLSILDGSAEKASLNGTFVNLIKVEYGKPPHRLKAGDQIKAGTVLLRVRRA